MSDERILVVEDDAIIAVHLKKLLMNLGYDVLGTVASGEEAIQKVNETPPDLVLMDIYLAGELNGIEAATQIRDKFNIPVVYLTAHSNDELFQEAKITEPYGYLIKPVQNRDLQAAVEISFYRHEMEKKLRESEERYRKLSEELEERVSQRTADLRKFANAAAGREVRMAELKNVIRELRFQLKTAGLTPIANDPLLGDREYSDI